MTFKDWLLKIKQHLAVTAVPQTAEVALAALYLEGEALCWCSAHSVSLLREGKHIAIMEVFVEAFQERFAYKNPESAARNKLLILRQDSRTIVQYMNEFDSCYNHLPSWDEQENIHKILFGLNRTWRDRCAINPQTGKRWVSYYPLALYLVSLLPETGLLTAAHLGAPTQQQASVSSSWA